MCLKKKSRDLDPYKADTTSYWARVLGKYTTGIYISSQTFMFVCVCLLHIFNSILVFVFMGFPGGSDGKEYGLYGFVTQ